MKIEKFKSKANICWDNGWRLDVNFHLSPNAEEHTGKETILDVLNSKASFIPLENFQTNEIFFVNKTSIMLLDLPERDLTEETKLAPEAAVQIKLNNGKMLAGKFLIEMPPERARVSDYLNFSSEFLYLCREEGDIILNKVYIHSVKDR